MKARYMRHLLLSAVFSFVASVMAFMFYQWWTTPNVYIHKVQVYFVGKPSTNVYDIGVIAELLNKNANEAVVIEGLSFEGEITISGKNVTIVKHVINVNLGEVTLGRQYFLPPGEGLPIKFTTNKKIEMKPTVWFRRGIIRYTYNGRWTVVADGQEFKLQPGEIVTNIISRSTWDQI